MNHATGARNLVRGWNDACKLIQESKKMTAHLLTPERNRNHQHYQQMDNTKLVTKLVETYTALKTAYRTSVVPAANPPPVESKAEPTAAAPPTAAAAISEAKKLDVNKVAAAAGGGAYDEEADPLNAPEVLEVVAQFKKKLEERDTSQKKRRMELVERKIKEIVVRVKKELKEEEQTRLERKVEQQVQVAVAGDKAGDSGKRGKSNLPAWMTRGTDAETGDAAAAVPPPPPPKEEEEESSRKRKFVPSEANRDINTRKQRLDVAAEGTKSLAEIRAENEAADAAAAATVTTQPTGPKPTKEQVLTISTTTFPLLLSPTHALYTSIRTHVTSCIVDYLGEEETTLIDFVMNQLCSTGGGGEGGGGVGGGATTMALLDEMKLVLDEDAEEFVWGLFCKFWELSFEEKK